REPPEFDLLRSVGHLRDLAACALCNLCSFPTVLRPLRRRACRKLRSLAGHGRPPADTQPSCGPRPGWRGSHSPSVSPFRKPRPNRDPVAAPAWQLPLVRAGYVCSVAWTAVCASAFRGAFFVSAQATVADRLLDRPEARYVANL